MMTIPMEVLKRKFMVILTGAFAFCLIAGSAGAADPLMIVSLSPAGMGLPIGSLDDLEPGFAYGISAELCLTNWLALGGELIHSRFSVNEWGPESYYYFVGFNEVGWKNYLRGIFLKIRPLPRLIPTPFFAIEALNGKVKREGKYDITQYPWSDIYSDYIGPKRMVMETNYQWGMKFSGGATFPITRRLAIFGESAWGILLTEDEASYCWIYGWVEQCRGCGVGLGSIESRPIYFESNMKWLELKLGVSILIG